MLISILAPNPKKVLQDQCRFVWQNAGTVIDRNGFPVNTKDEVWRLNEVSRAEQINWTLLKTASDVKDSMKAYATHVIETRAAQTAARVVDNLKHFLVAATELRSVGDLTYPMLEAALTKMRATATAWRFSTARQWYQWCTDQELPGFQREIAGRLTALKLPWIKSGLAIMSRDPGKGPLDDQEYRSVRHAVTNFAGEILEKICVMLILETGARPSQLVLLKQLDFRIDRTPSEDCFFSLDIPRKKQRTISGPLEKKRRRISSELGIALQELMASNHRQYGDQGPRMPLLCISKNIGLRKVPEPLRGEYDLHLSTDAFCYHVEHFAVSAKILSARTGMLLSLSPRRLRYTFGTRHADQGTPARLLAELLDHSHVGSVMSYVKSTSNAVDRLNQALGGNPQFTNLISRFLGRLEAKAGGEAIEQVIPGATPTVKNLGGIGVCGLGSLCGLYPPLSCYICPKFVAWIDGPHEQMLLELKAFVQGLKEHSGNPSDRIPKQLDEVIEAVQEVVAKINNTRREPRA